MKVSYVTTSNESVASFRYRIKCPAEQLQRFLMFPTIGPKADPEADVVIFSKHWNYSDYSYAKFCSLRGQKVIFDVCDDHFSSKHEHHYRRMCNIASIITCNSTEMAEIIRREVGREAKVIPDPVLSPRQDYHKKEPSMVWYGHLANLPGLYEVFTPDVSTPLEVVVPGRFDPPEHFKTELVSYSQWHPRIIQTAAKRHPIALLPYRQKHKAKSANRVLEAIYSGMFVLTDRLPAVENLGFSENVVWFLDQGLEKGIEHYKNTDLSEDISEAQTTIEEYYSPEVIAEEWKEVMEGK